MATYRKRGVKWRAEVCRNGVRRSESFDTKAEAIAWATQIEANIIAGKTGKLSAIKTFADACAHYIEKVAPTHRGARWEITRLQTLIRSSQLSGIQLDKVSQQHMMLWRDNRLCEVSPATVNRELNLISSVFEHAKREWLWCNQNPVHGIRRPPSTKPRDRRITTDEIDAMLLALEYQEGAPVTKASQRIAVAFLFAIETGMRAGEIVSLTWENVFLEEKYVRLKLTKNGDARNVPLSRRAVQLLQQLSVDADKPCFNLKSSSMDTLWRRARTHAAKECPSVVTLHFHDARHEAVTRLARKLDVLDLARMIGHRDPRSLMIYYNASATDIANRLD